MSPLSPRPCGEGRSPSARTAGWGAAEPNQAAFPGKVDLANKAADKSRDMAGWREQGKRQLERFLKSGERKYKFFFPS